VQQELVMLLLDIAMVLIVLTLLPHIEEPVTIVVLDRVQVVRVHTNQEILQVPQHVQLPQDTIMNAQYVQTKVVHIHQDRHLDTIMLKQLHLLALQVVKKYVIEVDVLRLLPLLQLAMIQNTVE
jgi:hypothetical protein